MARTAVVAGTASSVAGRVSMAQQDAVQAQTAPPAAASAGIDRLHHELTTLGELRQAGLITDEEFAAQKARLLASP